MKKLSKPWNSSSKVCHLQALRLLWAWSNSACQSLPVGQYRMLYKFYTLGAVMPRTEFFRLTHEFLQASPSSVALPAGMQVWCYRLKGKTMYNHEHIHVIQAPSCHFYSVTQWCEWMNLLGTHAAHIKDGAPVGQTITEGLAWGGICWKV